jgi:hypothetical protein
LFDIATFYQCHIFWNVVRQYGRICDDQVHSLIIELMEWRGSKGTWTSLFMVSLNIDFYTFKVNAHNTS